MTVDSTTTLAALGNPSGLYGYIEWLHEGETQRIEVLVEHGGGSYGDPHFTTWVNKHYDFHGHCDLVLLKNDQYHDGAGIAIHIRSSPFKTWFSYISAVVVKIGEDVFEIGGKGQHWLNGHLNVLPESLLRNGSLLQIDVAQPRPGVRTYTFKLDGGAELVIRGGGRNGWFRVKINHATKEAFGASQGLMGSFDTGALLGRDGLTVFHSVRNFGMEWQVQEELDGLLFQTPSPFPGACHLPPEDQDVHRRLGESGITHKEASAACAAVVGSEQLLEECIMDVMIAQDLEIATISY